MLQNNLKLLGPTMKTSVIESFTYRYPIFQITRSKKGKKPIYVPPAKTKIFNVIEDRVYGPHEKDLPEMMFHYENQLHGISQFLKTWYDEKEQLRAAKSNVVKKNEDEDYLSMHEEVCQWNVKSENARSESIVEGTVMLAKRNEFMEGIYQRSTEKRRRMAEQRLSLSLEECKSFITKDSIDSALDKLVNQHVDYNFAIDKFGNKITAIPDHA